MLEIATEGLKKIQIIDIENSYPFRGTVATLRELKHPYCVLGADSIKDLKSWIEYQDLVKENEFIVFPRAGFDALTFIQNDEWLKQYEHHFHFLSYELPAVSSSEFRKSKNPDLLDPGVFEYIKANNFY